MNDEQILLRKSYKDYEASVKLFLDCKDTMDDDALDIALYLMQQAVEKCLKSYLIWCGVDFKRKHDIDYLLMKCPQHLDCIPSIYNYAMEITLWEASTRYYLYTIEDINMYYTVLMDYCNLYIYVKSNILCNN